jgi:hypothetical protein
MITSLASLTIFIVGLTKPQLYEGLWIVGLITFFASPIVFETIINIKGAIFKGRLAYHKCEHLSECLPIVYSNGYNITAFGLEKCHPFDS